MRLTDRQFLALRRMQILTGVLPVGLFLLSHLAINGRAIAGRDAYAAAVERLARVPGLLWLEALAIGVPIVAHLALGVVAALSRQGVFQPAWPGPRLRAIQRASGFYLAMYLVIHVFSLRLAPERIAGERELFDLMAGQLRNPAVFALQALAVIAAGAHFGIGLAYPFGPEGFAAGRGARVARVAGAVAFVVLAAWGINALLAFVWTPAQWLAAR